MLPAVSQARGVVWSARPTVVFGSMAGVSCASASVCVAVGEVGYKGPPGAMGWDGQRWAQESVPNPGPAPGSADTPEGLTDVSCPSSTACVAVGLYDNALGEQLPMAVEWNGDAWSALPAPSDPAEGISCVSSSACMAVGGAYDQSGSAHAFAEWWDGSAWSVESMPSPGGLVDPTLNSVSCTSASACMAIGASSGRRRPQPIAARWDGSSWALERLPKRAGVSFVQLSQVSCASPTACVAVGSYLASEAQYYSGALIERWNGVNWTEQSTPGEFGLTGVSCSSARACTAVGESQRASGEYGAVVERWGGSTWTLSRLPGGVGLSAVSCSSAVTCTALGTAGGQVTAYQSAPTSATLSGVPAGCVRGPFTVKVTGLGISSVTWSLDSKRIRGASVRPGDQYAARIRLSPGRHQLTVNVVFQAYSHTRARMFRRVVVRCPAVH
jgi:hypothetical protein